LIWESDLGIVPRFASAKAGEDAEKGGGKGCRKIGFCTPLPMPPPLQPMIGHDPRPQSLVTNGKKVSHFSH
jgi:hypothetical protein